MEELSAVAAPGPVVIINASAYRCDAFLVRRDCSVKVVELRELHLKDIEEKVKSLRTTPHNLLQTPEWLWDVAACPILNELEPKPRLTHDDEWSHVWWIPTGPLSQLPFHAAGRHLEDSTNTALDRVMSSYSSSIKGPDLWTPEL
jgi:hypothetical protein